MSTDTPVILVAMGSYLPEGAKRELLRFYDQETPLSLVLLKADPSIPTPDGIEFDSIITNTGKKDHYLFRLNATDIITDHSNMIPVGVIELDQRWESTWWLPVIRYTAEPFWQ